ncbi:putative spore protein YtfJ [bioreactor metagenome]|uniref:Putative spore protein YtfJ n=1 Tax=bioreactor metagenome TaxID=1076179 RepID=A0A645DJK2_9ZZZZ
MEHNHPLQDLMSTTMQKIRDMVDANTIVGEPIPAGDGVTLIPVSKLAFGFASGGSDFVSKNQKPEATNPFGGGSGAGVTISPVAFLVVKDGTVRVLPVALPASNTVERVVEMVPDLVDKVTGFVEKQKDKDKDAF